MKRKIAIIGIGSAGVQSLCHMLTWLTGEWEVTSIYNPDINILGIGESTNPNFISAIQYGLDFDLIADLNALDATHKFGTKYKNWRKHEFVSPLILGTTAIHFNTHKLKDFALTRFRSLWGDKFKEIEGNVISLKNTKDYVSVQIDNYELKFDYVIDCRGFPSTFDETYEVIKDAPVNHALVHNINHNSKLDFTMHTATKNGWMFEIPLQSRTSYGYLYNDKITSYENAKQDFSETIGIDSENLDNIEYKFSSYYTNTLIQGRIIRNGNRAVFFEPMFANSLFIYDRINRYAIDIIRGSYTEQQVNPSFVVKVAKPVEDMIYFHYHGGSIFESEFWKHTKKSSYDKLMLSESFNRVTPILKNITKNKYWIEDSDSVWVYLPINVIKISKNFGYDYFT